ncbi:acyl-homoserine-lactone synthase [Sphingopyxis sp.]|uniref:acyl-homoserine-lactone synthase n=1 Tax=Sphingopyxis sp. TaxID=1908224 RepID=UPI002D78E99B|nr:acyl-homoserine-lactone synthase [Sphingopyxis sp.]HET6523523.1 acyl-homoserine-lactone synthase [Sphingopyxis sp.]
MQDNLVRAPQAPGDTALRAMFAARKQVFVDLLGWDVPVLAGQYEVDQYDTADAEYLILMDRDGRHRASTRLLRTDGPHLLGEYYAHLCDGPPPHGPLVREITRFCLDRNQSAAERRSARNQLVTALAEHALRCGITDYIGVAEPGWLCQIVEFGWDCRTLGSALEIGTGLGALHIRIDDKTLAGLRERGIYQPAELRLTAGRGLEQ